MKGRNPFATLRRLARSRRNRKTAGICGFCSSDLSPHHRHLMEVAKRKISCACDACALRLENAAGGRFKLIPRETRALPDFQLSDAQWENLALPINLVFILHSSTMDRPVAIFPSPAGAAELLPAFGHWQAIVAANPELENLKPDVEALLINRVGDARDYLIAPVDVCFELAGLIRKNWRGRSGGQTVWQEIETFFARLGEQTALFAKRTRPLKLENVYA